MAMVATGELDDFISARATASDANRAHSRLRTGAYQPHSLHAWKGMQNQFGDSRLVFGRSAVGSSSFGSFHDRFDDTGFRVSENHRAPRSDVVDELVAVDIEEIRTFGAFDEQRMASDGTKSTGWGVHSSGNELSGPFEGSLAFLEFHGGLSSGQGFWLLSEIRIREYNF
jgi:hypothetical protein